MTTGEKAKRTKALKAIVAAYRRGVHLNPCPLCDATASRWSCKTCPYVVIDIGTCTTHPTFRRIHDYFTKNLLLDARLALELPIPIDMATDRADFIEQVVLPAWRKIKAKDILE